MLMSDDDGARQDAIMLVHEPTRLAATTLRNKCLNVVLSCRMNSGNVLVRGWLTLCLHRGTCDIGHHMEVRSHARSTLDIALCNLSRAEDVELTSR